MDCLRNYIFMNGVNTKIMAEKGGWKSVTYCADPT